MENFQAVLFGIERPTLKTDYLSKRFHFTATNFSILFKNNFLENVVLILF